MSTCIKSKSTSDSFPKIWSLKPLKKSPRPKRKTSSVPQDVIDAFIAEKKAAARLARAAAANFPLVR